MEDIILIIYIIALVSLLIKTIIKLINRVINKHKAINKDILQADMSSLLIDIFCLMFLIMISSHSSFFEVNYDNIINAKIIDILINLKDIFSFFIPLILLFILVIIQSEKGKKKILNNNIVIPFVVISVVVAFIFSVFNVYLFLML